MYRWYANQKPVGATNPTMMLVRFMSEPPGHRYCPSPPSLSAGRPPLAGTIERGDDWCQQKRRISVPAAAVLKARASTIQQSELIRPGVLLCALQTTRDLAYYFSSYVGGSHKHMRHKGLHTVELSDSEACGTPGRPQLDLCTRLW